MDEVEVPGHRMNENEYPGTNSLGTATSLIISGPCELLSRRY
ncbi:MAG: hypothetical protein QXY82_01195 [Desulfurococcaceae archaeon]